MKDAETGDLLPEDFKGGLVKEFFLIIFLYLKKLYRSTLVLLQNPAFLTATLGMAFMTYSLGGIQVWMPQFLYSERHYTLENANLMFGVIIVIDGIVASLLGGWLGDYLLPRMKSAYYVVSAASMLLGVPVMIVALFVRGPMMIPAIGVAAFFLLLNTAPLNAAVINSVGAHIRATALAVNIFIIHILGDVPSPTMMGWVADKRSMQAAFILPVIAMGISSAILFYGMKFAPPVAVRRRTTPLERAEDLGQDGLLSLDCGNDSRAGVVLPHRGRCPWHAERGGCFPSGMGSQSRIALRQSSGLNHCSGPQRRRDH